MEGKLQGLLGFLSSSIIQKKKRKEKHFFSLLHSFLVHMIFPLNFCFSLAFD